MLQPDQKIINIRNRNNGLTTGLCITRHNQNGTIDNNFGTNGKAIIDLPGTVNQSFAGLLSSGRIAVVINFKHTLQGNRIGILRFQLDNINVTVQQDEKILLSGSSYNPSTGELSYQVARLNSNGKKDNSFGPFGSVFIDPVAANSNNSTSMLLQADGKILVTGYTQNENYYSDFAMIRLNNNGLSAGQRYVFTGSGNWSNPANWGDGAIPPATIPAGSSVMIDPLTGGACIIDVTVRVPAGASFTVKEGKKLLVQGNLMIHQ